MIDNFLTLNQTIVETERQKKRGTERERINLLFVFLLLFICGQVSRHRGGMASSLFCDTCNPCADPEGGGAGGSGPPHRKLQKDRVY